MSKEELDEVCHIIKVGNMYRFDTCAEQELRRELISQLHTRFDGSLKQSLPDATGDSA